MTAPRINAATASTTRGSSDRNLASSPSTLLTGGRYRRALALASSVAANRILLKQDPRGIDQHRDGRQRLGAARLAPTRQPSPQEAKWSSNGRY